MEQITWQGVTDVNPTSFKCAYCGKDVSSHKGWHANAPPRGHGSASQDAAIFLCHRCLRPTFIDTDGSQTPGAPAGEDVQGISDESVKLLYKEARAAVGASAPTAGVLACRKLLMHVAVAKGAEAGKNFVAYVEFFAAHNYIPPDAREWVDHIRTKANEANHEILIMSKEDAIDLLSFSEMLLKLVYEFPSKIKLKTQKK